MYNPGVTSPSSDGTPDGTTDGNASLSEAQVGAPVTAYERAIRHLETAQRLMDGHMADHPTGRARLHTAMASVWSDLAYTEAFREGLGTPEASEGRSEAHRASEEAGIPQPWRDENGGWKPLPEGDQTQRVQPGPRDQATAHPGHGAEAAPLVSQGHARIPGTPTRAPKSVSPHGDVPTHGARRQWVDRDGDLWTVIGFLDGGHVLVTSGGQREAEEWLDTGGGDGDLRTLAYVEKTWGPLRRAGADDMDG